MEKKIIIQGKTNRYQIKKLLDYPKICERKKIHGELLYDYDFQKKSLYEKNHCHNIMTQEINKKIESYKTQDKLKNRDMEHFIEFRDIEEMLKKEMICHYCRENIFVLYKLKLDKKQWTLDRIDNNLAHKKTNVVLSCLKCNLERRCVDKEKYIFTKNLNIVKKDSENNLKGDVILTYESS